MNSRDTVAYIMQRLGNTNRITTRYEQGENKILVDGKEVAIISDDLLYIPVCPASAALESECETDVPYLGAKEHYTISEDQLATLPALSKILFAISRTV
jgi:hypothetical protein